MLGRLGIRQKLTLLLAIPLSAVVLVLIPFTAERISDARAAGTTAATASAAREIGGLLEALQQERLLTLGYLSVSTLDRSALVAQTQTAQDEAARLRDQPGTAAVVAAAKPALDALAGLRPSVIDRSVGSATAYQAFRDADSALLGALHLSNQPGADAVGLSQLSALDELMRSNEEASSVGAVLVAIAADPALSRNLLTDAVSADQQHLQRFRELVPAGESALVDTVDNGEAGQRIRQIVARYRQPGTGAAGDLAEVSDALTAAVGYTDLRRFAQDRVAREVTTDAQSRAASAAVTAYAVSGGAVILLLAVIGLGLAVSRSIARPLRRLTRAASVVAELSAAELVRVADSDSDEAQAPQLAAIEVDTADEIGELAQALNRVQSTAASLLERQVSTRHNVSVMFANIARRTQNLVGRQLSLLDDLERNERSPELRQRLYRLDHVATRLRRSADSLLVVSGTIDQSMSGVPTLLADVVRSALSEIEGYESIDIGELPPVAVLASVVADLRLLLAELLENATNFSPPGSRVSVLAIVDGDCRISVVDHGLGIGQARLDEENQRLLERERLDVAPSNVLGLFVVGRLARRHGLSVRLSHTKVRGVTATVHLPGRLLTEPVPGRPGALATRVRPLPPRHRAEVTVHPAIQAYEAIEASGPFPWFVPPRELPAGASATYVAPRSRQDAPGPSTLTWPPLPVTAAAAAGEASRTRAGLARRVPGTHMIAGDGLAPVPAPAGQPPSTRAPRDPEAEREMLNDYLSGFSKATADNQSSDSTLAERHS